MTNYNVKQEISRLQTENKAIQEYTRKLSREKLDSAYDIAKKQKNPAGMVAAVREMDSIYGLQVQNVVIDDKTPIPVSESDAVRVSDELRARLKVG